MAWMSKVLIFNFTSQDLFTVKQSTMKPSIVGIPSMQNRFDKFKASICDRAKRRTNRHAIEDGCSFNSTLIPVDHNSTLIPAMVYLYDHGEMCVAQWFANFVFSVGFLETYFS